MDHKLWNELISVRFNRFQLCSVNFNFAVIFTSPIWINHEYQYSVYEIRMWCMHWILTNGSIRWNFRTTQMNKSLVKCVWNSAELVDKLHRPRSWIHLCNATAMLWNVFHWRNSLWIYDRHYSNKCCFSVFDFWIVHIWMECVIECLQMKVASRFGHPCTYILCFPKTIFMLRNLNFHF